MAGLIAQAQAKGERQTPRSGITPLQAQLAEEKGGQVALADKSRRKPLVPGFLARYPSESSRPISTGAKRGEIHGAARAIAQS
jgi:hypothetical protein